MSQPQDEAIVNDTGWQTVEEEDATASDKGRIRQRRTYVVAPNAAAESANRNTTKNPSSQKIKKKPLSKQQQILRQLQAQQRQEDAETSAFNAATDQALTGLWVKYLKTASILVVIGLGLLLYLAPHLLWKWIQAIPWMKPQLTSRSLVVVFPHDVTVRHDLPLVTGAYGIKTESNAAARRAVVHVARLRTAVAEAPPSTRQTIRLHAWEHGEFLQQTTQTADMMERFCGPGFRRQYGKTVAVENGENDEDDDNTIPAKKKDDLMIWCFLANGHHDGFVKYEVQDLAQRLSQGTQGVAVLRYPVEQHHRIHSDSFLFLPVHNLTDVQGDTWIGSWLFGRNNNKKRKNQKLAPTTMVAYRALEWLNVNAGMTPVEAYTKVLEQLLYEWIVQREVEEQGKHPWYLLHAACTPYDRRQLMATQMYLGSSCPSVIVEEYDSIKQRRQPEEEDGAATTTTTIVPKDMKEWADCCTFHDPNFPASFRYKREKEQVKEEEDGEP